jgi:hypothetical protein
MGEEASHEEVLLAVALGSPRTGGERRTLPDRRSGVERRRTQLAIPGERRSGGERRQAIRRRVDREEGATLLQKARTRLSVRFRQQSD